MCLVSDGVPTLRVLLGDSLPVVGCTAGIWLLVSVMSDSVLLDCILPAGDSTADDETVLLEMMLGDTLRYVEDT